MKEKVCGNCKYCKGYSGTFGQYGRCEKPGNAACFPVGRNNTGCSEFERKSSKVKPRRLCDFCERRKRMESEEWEHDLRLVKLTPVTPIDLTNPNAEEIKLEKPFYAMFLRDPEYGDEAATFQVKFCPFCGRKLVGE